MKKHFAPPMEFGFAAAAFNLAGENYSAPEARPEAKLDIEGELFQLQQLQIDAQRRERKERIA